MMEAVPIAFVDALCATLKKKDLNILQEIGRRWTSTVTTHYSRRREFDACIQTNADETEVDITICETPSADVNRVAHVIAENNIVHYTSLSKHDRIVKIGMQISDLVSLGDDYMSLERYRTKVEPVLNAWADAYAFNSTHVRYTTSPRPENITGSVFSGLCAPARKIRTAYFGGRCVEFIEQQIALGRLEHLELHGKEWPDTLRAHLKTFLRSPNFVSLDLSGNLKVDLDMLTCIVQRFFKGDLLKGNLRKGDPREGMPLQGQRSEDLDPLYTAVRLGHTLPWSGRHIEPSYYLINGDSCFEVRQVEWTGPGHETLRAVFFATSLTIYHTT
uniref:F-box domain-containing protein n=1 Tax=Steinernema glaseri TaxID=37863 RepID=A0A1I7ZZX1_9BILA